MVGLGGAVGFAHLAYPLSDGDILLDEEPHAESWPDVQTREQAVFARYDWYPGDEGLSALLPCCRAA